jgi:hypothetical protein
MPVNFEKSTGYWRATYKSCGESIEIGYFRDEIDATIALHRYKQSLKDDRFRFDYNKLSKNPAAWENKAKDILKKLSARYASS